jgi:hypothetical protein
VGTGKNLFLGVSPFGHLERLGLELSVLLKQDLDLAFRVLDLLATGVRKLDSLFKQGERIFERDVALFQFAYNFLQSLETFFELGHSPTLAKNILMQIPDAVGSIFSLNTTTATGVVRCHPGLLAAARRAGLEQTDRIGIAGREEFAKR